MSYCDHGILSFVSVFCQQIALNIISSLTTGWNFRKLYWNDTLVVLFQSCSKISIPYRILVTISRLYTVFQTFVLPHFYPPTRKGSGDIAISLASVRLSVCPSVRLSVRLSVRRQKLVRSITFIPFEIF